MKKQTVSDKNPGYFGLIVSILICLLCLTPAKPAQAVAEPIISFALTNW